MNGWDLFTWLNCAVLAFAALIIFGFFCRDAGGILIGQRDDADADAPAAAPRDERPVAPDSDAR